VFKYLVENRPEIYRYVWLIDDPDVENMIIDDIRSRDISEDITIVPRKSLKAIWCCYRARYIFTTVGLFVHIKFHQKDKRINMWHGMPLKRIYSGDMPNGDYTVSNSDLFIKYLSQGLNIEQNHVLVLGQPRNDMLYHPEFLHDKYACRLTGYKKVGIWMPTFRQSKIDTQYSDGDFYDDRISFVKLDELCDLNEKLKELETLLIIKLHPLDILQEKEIKDYSNLFVLKSNNFEQRYLYALLSRCDFLLSDFSSVVVDYEILNRPIGIIINDLESYSKSRGFFPIEIPGQRVDNIYELYSFIQNVHNDSLRLKDYGSYYNKYRNDKSTERLLTFLKL
jgi:CDP-glycerol glycerophosphotransferase (TagB/SpsB family)